jgi:hypothetical protein
VVPVKVTTGKKHTNKHLLARFFLTSSHHHHIHTLRFIRKYLLSQLWTASIPPINRVIKLCHFRRSLSHLPSHLQDLTRNRELIYEVIIVEKLKVKDSNRNVVVADADADVNTNGDSNVRPTRQSTLRVRLSQRLSLFPNPANASESPVSI